MEKSWAGFFVIWIVLNLAYLLYGFYDNLPQFAGRFILGIVILAALYKTFRKPFPLGMKDIRKERTAVYTRNRDIIGILFGGVIFIIFLISIFLGMSEVTMISVLGFAASMACQGIYFMYVENPRVLKLLLAVLLILVIVFTLSFISQSFIMLMIRLVSMFSIPFIGLALALYAGYKSIIYLPVFCSLKAEESRRRRKKKTQDRK
jgi:hypothetical protein